MPSNIKAPAPPAPTPGSKPRAASKVQQKKAAEDELDIQSLENFCVNNEQLASLESLLGSFNVFEAVGLAKQETKHSTFLAFLLDPCETHGLGDSFLELFLRRIIGPEAAKALGVTPLNLHLWDLTSTTVAREWCSIDVMVTDEKNQFVVAIENKVNIGEHSDQLDRYKTTVCDGYPDPWKRVFIYLSPEGSPPSVTDYLAVSYNQVSEVVSALLDKLQGSMSPAVLLAVQHYRDLLAKFMVANSEVGELCSQIYRRHHRAIDLIVARRDDRREDVRTFLLSVSGPDGAYAIESQTLGSIHVFPKAWSDFVPEITSSDGSILHLLYLLVRNDRDGLAVHIEMRKAPPGDVATVALRKKLHAFAYKTPPFKTRKEESPVWNRIYGRDLLAATYYRGDPEEFRRRVKSVWQTFETDYLEALGAQLRAASQPAAKPAATAKPAANAKP